MNLPALALSLPLVFMLHDFEELIGAEPWLRANRAALLQRFPRFAPPWSRICSAWPVRLLRAACACCLCC